MWQAWGEEEDFECFSIRYYYRPYAVHVSILLYLF